MLPRKMDYKRGEKRKEAAADLPSVEALCLWKEDNEKDSSSRSTSARLREAVLKEVLNLSGETIGDFLKAVKNFPDIVRTESDPLMHLKCQRRPDDFRGAALQLAEYWKFRCEVFQERAHQPMNINLLTKEEKEILKTGGYALLPRDDLERGVLLTDYKRFDGLEQSQPEACLRVLFCLLSLVNSVTDRVVSVTLGYSGKKKNLPRIFGNKKLQLIPILFDATIVILDDKTQQQDALQVKESLNEIAPGTGSVLMNPTAEDLEDRGFDTAGLPSFCGGTWRYESFFAWIETTEKLGQPASFSLLEKTPSETLPRSVPAAAPPPSAADTRDTSFTPVAVVDPSLERLARAAIRAYQEKMAVQAADVQ